MLDGKLTKEIGSSKAECGLILRKFIICNKQRMDKKAMLGALTNWSADLNEAPAQM